MRRGATPRGGRPCPGGGSGAACCPDTSGRARGGGGHAQGGGSSGEGEDEQVREQGRLPARGQQEAVPTCLRREGAVPRSRPLARWPPPGHAPCRAPCLARPPPSPGAAHHRPGPPNTTARGRPLHSPPTPDQHHPHRARLEGLKGAAEDRQTLQPPPLQINRHTHSPPSLTTPPPRVLGDGCVPWDAATLVALWQEVGARCRAASGSLSGRDGRWRCSAGPPHYWLGAAEGYTATRRRTHPAPASSSALSFS